MTGSDTRKKEHHEGTTDVSRHAMRERGVDLLRLSCRVVVLHGALFCLKGMDQRLRETKVACT